VKLFKQVYIYFGSYLINAVLSFGMVSLLTHYLSTYDYGIINLYSSFIIFLTPFISGGILYPLSVEYFKNPPEGYSRYFTNAQVIPVTGLLLFSLLCVIFQQPLSHFLKVPVSWIWVLPLTTWWIMVNEIVLIITRNKNQPAKFAFFSVGKNLAEILLTISFVIGLHLTWQGRLLSAALAPVLMGVFSIYLFYRWRLLVKKIEWGKVRQIFLISFPFIFERLAVFVLGYSDKYFIDHFDLRGTKEVGLYGLGNQLSSIIYLVIVSLNSAYHPHLFKKIAEGFKGSIHKTTWWYIGGCALAIGGLFIFMPLLFHFFIGKQFYDAQPYAYILSGGYLMWGVYNAFLGYLLYLQKNRQIFYISLMGMTGSLAINSYAVPHYGAMGAAITSGVTYSIMATACFLYMRKYFLFKTSI
jgi:O-antigen/teichoic acid export membrane protein